MDGGGAMVYGEANWTNQTTFTGEEYFIKGFTPDQIDVLTILTGISAALSMVGSGMIVATYLFLSGTRSFAFQMVFMLSACDFFSSLAFLIALGKNLHTVSGRLRLSICSRC